MKSSYKQKSCFTRIFLALVLMLSLTFIPLKSHAQLDDLLNCWEEAYAPDFQIQEAMKTLESSLLKNRFLKDTTITSYKRLFDLIRKQKGALDWSKINTDLYISPVPFKNCLKQQQPDKNDPALQRMVYLFSIYHILSRDHATFFIKVYNDSKIITNGASTDLKQFNEIFKSEYEVMIDQGITKPEMIVNLKYLPATGQETRDRIKAIIGKYQIESLIIGELEE